MAAPIAPTSAITPTDVLPKTPDESAVPPASEPVSDSQATIPDAVLEIPAVFGLLRGAPAAVSVPIGYKSPETATIAKYGKELVDAGFGFFDSQDKSTRVLFNEAYVSAKQLSDADKAGKLSQVVVPLDEINATLTGQGGPASPALPATSPGNSIAAPAGTPPAASAQRKLNTQRVKNLQPGSPTSGAYPGGGRILNNVLQQTV